jgi:hypothetical protein
MSSYKIIRHRINSVVDLKAVDTLHGVEIDVRDRGSRLILAHDPFCDGVDFDEFLNHYRHDTLIVNIKSEGIEDRVLREIEASGNVNDFFFLDCSFPMIRRLSLSGERRLSLRLSEFESVETILRMAEGVSWVWIDCFTKNPLNNEIYSALRAADLKICIVSPELQGRSISDIPEYRQSLNEYPFDAVCTKEPHFWVSSSPTAI